MLLPLLFIIIALTSFDLSLNVALSSFEISNKHPVALHADALWNAQNEWQTIMDGKPSSKRLLHASPLLAPPPPALNLDVSPAAPPTSTQSRSRSRSRSRRSRRSRRSNADDEEEEKKMEEEEEHRRTDSTRGLASVAKKVYLTDRLELVFYPDNGGSILRRDYLTLVKKVETIVTNVEGYKKYCWKPYLKSRKDVRCAPPNSLTTYFFPSRQIDGTIRFDGLGPMTPFYDFTMAEILNQPSSYFFFRYFFFLLSFHCCLASLFFLWREKKKKKKVK
jgi:hypothetical protein